MRHARRRLRQVVKLLIRPAPPTGPGPVTASGQVAARHEASLSGGHTRGHQPTAQHHQAALAILTVIAPPVGTCPTCPGSADVRVSQIQLPPEPDRSREPGRRSKGALMASRVLRKTPRPDRRSGP
jgi:hypothetical protein